MIVFNNYAILIVVNVILSLKDINATVPDEYLREALLEQHECIELLKKPFPGNDVREHAKIAFHYLANYMSLYTDIRGYYLSFEEHLREGSIPTIEVFCLNYNSPDLCEEFVRDQFGSPPYEALMKAFYGLRHSELIPKYVPANILYNQTNLSVDENMRLVVNVIAEYWDTILNNFGIVTEGNGMRNPIQYCEGSYPLPQDKDALLPGH